MKVQIYTAVLILCCVLLFYAGCTETPEVDIGIGEITIFNIPAKINSYGNDPHDQVYKVYINASDYQEADKPHKAQGTADLKVAAGADFADEVTIPLYNPPIITNPKPGPDDTTGGRWYGEAKFFSIVISPQDVTTGAEEDIWIKAGLTLNKGKARMDWEKITYDFRTLKDNPDFASFEFNKKQQALFAEVVCMDDAIKTQ